MKFKTHNDNIPFVGGCLQGYICAKYNDLKKLFGKPTDGDGYKVDAEWSILFEDGTSATIYNYKNGKNYNGENGTPKTKITEWNIGGNNSKAVENIVDLLGSL